MSTSARRLRHTYEEDLRREGTTWRVLAGGRGETVTLESIGGRIVVDEVYRDGLEDPA